MITAIIAPGADAKSLARLLTALVPAAAEGLVRQVAVVGAEGACADIADDAGADLLGSFEAAVRIAKGPWLAGLPLPTLFAPDWMEIVMAHLEREPAKPARLVSRARLSLGGGLEGWLAPKALAPSATVVEQDLKRLARRGGALRILDRR